MTIAKFKSEPCSQCGTPRSVIDGQWLRTVRKNAGLSLREMAKRLGYSVPYICDVELNRRHCTPTIRDGYENLTSFGGAWVRKR